MSLNKIKRIVIDVPEATHETVRRTASGQHVTMKKFLLRAIQRELNRLEQLKNKPIDY